MSQPLRHVAEMWPSPALRPQQTVPLSPECAVVKKGITQRLGNTIMALAKKKKRKCTIASLETEEKWEPIDNEKRFRHDAKHLRVLRKVNTKAVTAKAKAKAETSEDSKTVVEKAREKQMLDMDWADASDQLDSDEVLHSTVMTPLSVAGTGCKSSPLRSVLPAIDEDTDVPIGKKVKKGIQFVTATGEPMPDKQKTDEDNYTYWRNPKKEKAKRIVFFDGKLKRVSEIETASETFRVRFHYYLTWLMSHAEVVEYFTAKVTYGDDFEDKWKPDWYPQLQCENRVEGDMQKLGAFKVKEGVSFECLKKQKPMEQFNHGYDEKSSFDISEKQLGFDPRFAFWCRVQYECDLLCAEELELDFFPFDCQDLGVYMRAKEKADACDILPFPRYGEMFNIDAQYSMVSEWKIPGVMLEFNQGKPEASKMRVPYNAVVIRVKAERKWEAHLADSTTIFCMFWLGLATFSVPVEDVGDRLAYSITLLLADIATMQLLNETTPTIPYRTFLDTYTYACFIFLVVITIWVAIAGFGGESTVSHVADWWMFWFFAVALVSMHLVFINMIHFGRRNERKKLTTNTAQLEELMEDCVNRDSASSMPMAAVSWNSLSIEPKKEWTKDKEQMKKWGIETCKGKKDWAARSYPWAKDVDDDYQKTDPLFVNHGVEEKKGVFDKIGEKLELLRTSSFWQSADEFNESTAK